MQHFLDMRTLIFVSGITSLILFACMFYIRRKQKTYDGFLSWVFAALSNAIGMLLLSQRDILPDFFSVITGNTLLLFSIVLINTGLSRFSGMRPAYNFYAGYMIVFVALYLYLTYVVPSLPYRVMVFSLFQMTLCALMIVIARRDLPRVLNKRNYALHWFLVLCAAWPLFRAIACFFEQEHLTNLMTAGFSHQFTFLGSIAAYIILVIALIIINAQRAEQEMLTVKDEIKTIAGLIPICATCKKIRDDKGSWSQLESYLGKHADLEFSHALCPECMQKMYPEKSSS